MDGLIREASSALQWLQSRFGTEAGRPADVPGTRMAFTVNVESDPLDGGYVAEVMEMPGCVAQGETEQEALDNIIDALTDALEVRMHRQARTMLPMSKADGKQFRLLVGAP